MRKALLFGLVLSILLINSITIASAASSIYNNRYLGDPNEPSTSYYSYTGKSSSGSIGASSSSYSSSRPITVFKGPYTEHYIYKSQNGIQIPSSSFSTSGYFNNGGGYSPSRYYGGYGGYGGYGYYGGGYSSGYGWFGGYYGGSFGYY